MTSALRKKLLSLAIRGKLVPQDPADEPASVLLERIRAEREAKENESPRRGRGRRSSSDNPPCPKRGTSAAVPTGVEDAVFEPPFPIPESWTWTKLEEVCEILDYMRRPVTRKHRTKGEYPYYGATGIQDYVAEWIFDETLVLLGEDGAKWAAGDNSAFLITGKTWVNNHAHVLRPNASLLHEWLILVLNGLDLLPFVTCTTVPKLNQEKTRTIPIPLPPISEQRNIVSRFEELSSFCDSIDEDSIALDTLARTAKSRILDLAIRGALVSQNPTDEPASILLDRIRSTADKPPCPKLPANPPFPIPQNWAWTTLGTVCDYGKCETVDASTVKDSTWSLDLEDIEKGTGRLLVRVRAGERSAAGARHSFRAGELLYSKLRTYLNKVLVADEDGICSSEILPLDFRGQVLPEYARCVLMSPLFLDYAARCGYGVKMPRLGTADGRNGPFPLPPLAEQRRIVAKVDEMFATIDEMLG